MHQHTPFVEYSFPLQLIELTNDKTIGRWNLRQADLVLCVSQDIEKYVNKLEKKADTKILNNGVNTAHFHPNRAEGVNKFDCGPDTPVFFTLSRMSQKKGMDILLKAAKKIDQENIDAHFAVAGDGPMREKIEHTAQRVGNMDVLGRISDEELAEYYAAADVFLFTSKSGEAFPTLTMMEAYASGTPVIASKLSENTIGVENTTNSILTDPGNPKMLKEAIIELATAKNRLSQMSNNARESAEQYFSIESKIDKLETHYKSVIASRDQ